MNTKGSVIISGIVSIAIMFMGASAGAVSYNNGETIIRSRDVARGADLISFQGALDMYVNDYGQYPPSEGECLSAETETVTDTAYLLQEYMKGGRVPQDSSGGTVGGLCGAGSDHGRYWYRSITAYGVANNRYILCASAEQNANARGAAVIAAIVNQEDAAFTTALNIEIPDNLTDSTNGLYCVTN